MLSVWEALGISATRDERTIRLAYTARLKVTNPEDKPEDFKILRAAYETAIKTAAAKKPTKEITAGLISAAAPAVAVAPTLSDYQALCLTLEKLVVAQSDRGDTMAALKAIFAAPDFQRIGVQARTEIWLLRLIVLNAPRSDILLPEAISNFGWSEGASKREIAQLTRIVFQRVRDLKACEEMSKPSGHYHRAFVVLTKPFERPKIQEHLNLRGLYWEVRQCLDFIRRNHPALMPYLNKQSVAAWQAELTKIRFPAEGWLALLATPPAILLYNFCTPNVSPNNIQFLQLLLLPIPIFVGTAIYMLAWRIPRRTWRDHWRALSPAWVAWGWAPALLLILLLTALIPAGVSAAILVAGALTWQAMSHDVLAPLAIAATLCVALMTIVPAMELPASWNCPHRC